jgi:sodium-dependent phosphate transporter
MVGSWRGETHTSRLAPRTEENDDITEHERAGLDHRQAHRPKSESSSKIHPTVHPPHHYLFHPQPTPTLFLPHLLISSHHLSTPRLHLFTMPMHQYDYVFAIGTFFAVLDAYNNGASK